MTKPVHPTEVPTDDPLDHPASEATLGLVIARLNLTEREARALADAPADINEDLLAEALKANLQGIAAAFSAPTVKHLETDTKLEPSPRMPGFQAAALRVRTIASAIGKLENLIHLATAEARLDAGQLQGLVYDVIRQLKPRALLNAAVATVYATLFAYHHARHPGHGHAPQPAAAVNATARSA
jgi:hypothetical protein